MSFLSYRFRDAESRHRHEMANEITARLGYKPIIWKKGTADYLVTLSHGVTAFSESVGGSREMIVGTGDSKNNALESFIEKCEKSLRVVIIDDMSGHERIAHRVPHLSID